MKQITFELPTIDQVEFTIECHEEHIPVRGNALASGDDKQDKRVEDSIIRSLNNGNPWSWCTVEVTASYNGLQGTDTLGCCSYKSEKDFIKNSGYYEDMKQQAYDELIEKLRAFEK